MKIWNEIVQAYEEQRAILEAAREEYDRACKAVIEEIHRKAREETNWGVPDYLRLEVSLLEESGAGQYQIEIKFKEGDLTWMRIFAWVASAFDGDPKKLQVGAVLYPRDGSLLVGVEQMRQQVKDLFGAESGARGADVDESVISFCSVPVDDEQVTTNAMTLVRKYVSKVLPLVDGWHEEEAPIRALLEAKRQLQQTLLVKQQVVSPKKMGLNQQARMLYVWLSEPKPSVWIGYDADTQSLLLAHDEIEDDPGLTKRLATKVGGKATTFDNFPAVRLFTRGQLRKQSQQELVDAILEAFRQYYKLQP